VLGIDDTPTARYGRHVEGAGVHRNPTGGPADGEWLYGHNWVALAWLGRHPGVGCDRVAVTFAAVRPPGRRAQTGGEIRLGIPHQTSIGVELLTWFKQ